MSSVIPVALKGNMIPHPYKTDTWIEGTRTPGDNRCMEIQLPTSPFGSEEPTLDMCVLGMKQSFLEYAGLGNVHQTQVHAKVKRLLGHEKIINSFYSGATPNQLMPELDVEALAIRLISEHEEDLTWLDNSLGTVRVAYLQESAKLYSSLAVNNSFKEQGLMQDTINLVLATQVQLEEKQLFGGTPVGEMPIVSAKTSEGMSQLIEQIESVDGTQALVKTPKLASLDSVRRPKKRKKSKAKSPHIPNMRSGIVKRALGASILMKLGQIQQDTQDAYKRALLKELPAADFIEMATGEKLPDYQANLINSMQAKADPEAPIVTRMQDGVLHVEIDENDPDPVRTLETVQSIVKEARGVDVKVAQMDEVAYLADGTVPAIRAHVDAIEPMLGRGRTNPELYVPADEFGNPV